MSDEALLVEDLERGELAGQERDVLGVARRGGPPGARLVRRCVGGAVSSIRRPLSCRPRRRRRRRSVARRRRPRPYRRCRAVRGGSVTTCARSGRRRSCAGRPSPRRSAPGSAVRRRSRSSRRARTTPSISRPRAAADSSAISAPVPAALPAERTWSRSQSGISPRTIAWAGRSGCRTRRPAGSRRRHRSRAGPSAAGRRHRARPWRAGWPARRSG